MLLVPSKVAVNWASDYVPASSKDFLDIQATTEWGFYPKHERDTKRTYSQIHRTEKYLQHSSII